VQRYPSLFNWICSRARTYGVFRAVFLQPHPSFDGLARQLDPNNYAFLNLENTKKGKKKRQSSSRQNQDDGSELSRSVKSSAAEEFDDMPSPSPSPSPSHMSKSLKVDAFRGQGHRRMKYVVHQTLPNLEILISSIIAGVQASSSKVIGRPRSGQWALVNGS
jgi:hypothetical protein